MNKFGHKMTTDDCYTPDAVYDAVLNWVCDEYGLDPANAVRPFWPGGDYEHYAYPADCVVIDNPPFSMLARIVRFYVNRRIPFFLFAPYLTNLSSYIPGCNHVITDYSITYENGAVVNTSFLTSLGDDFIRTAPALAEAIAGAMRVDKKTMPRRSVRYVWPDELITAPMLGRMGRHGIDFRLSADDCVFVRRLDAQPKGKGVFGAGYLLTPDATRRKLKCQSFDDCAQQDQTIVVRLSQRERDLIDAKARQCAERLPEDRGPVTV